MKTKFAVLWVYLACALLLGSLISCGGGGGGGNSGGGLTPVVPSITAVSPTDALVGRSDFHLVVNGANFSSAAVVLWNSNPLATTFVNSGKIQADVPATSLTVGVAVKLSVKNGDTGKVSASFEFDVYNPAPTLTSISPTNAKMGLPVTITVTGSAFVSNSQVQWNGTAVATTFVSSTQLTADISAAQLGSATPGSIKVFNPGPRGGTSEGQTLLVVNAATTITTLDVSATAIVNDPTHGKLYATGAFDGSNYGVLAIDPLTGAAGTSQPVTGPTSQLALSSDGSYLWIGGRDNNLIQRVTLPGFAPDVTITIPPNHLGEKMFPLSMAAAPVGSHALAVMRSNYSTGADSLGVIYDDATPRANAITPGTYTVAGVTWLT
ncbi:cell surface receptor IPT/TIG [Candidatus Koribacter versatilis Ellin345]|uniref:Cell surface receptor IPT/TIG n=1 Tax=Koribacter versatilis (strain Ellin345) TaxID=204669 RepID=Q1ISY0_KORVE|nr:IPT/TIG domain-containing protein [Candidatus Koribacter versatilis]ABF40020.1 cell surface receptor IPT/TIG [Candidatus Koribacter versatilis Ellin345]